MDTNLGAIISASSAVAVAVVALVANVVWIGRAFNQLDSNLSARLDRIERRLTAIEDSCRERGAEHGR